MLLKNTLLGSLVIVGLVWASTFGGQPVPRDTLSATLSIDMIPLGLHAKRPIPTDNPLTEAGVQLGRKLFFDPVLSRDKTISCASCHDPAHAFAGVEVVAIGIGGKKGRRNVPTLFNRAYAAHLFWDGRESSLEEQALKPIEDPLEMDNSVAEVVRRLQAHSDYPALFKKAFGDEVTKVTLGKALASFQRTLLLGNSRIDRFRLNAQAGDLNESERHGLWLWESKARCWRCHNGPNFSDEQFHNTGVSWGKQPLDLGRYEVTGTDSDKGRFKTPTLRAVALTAPYMHDGSIATLEEVVQYYNEGGRANTNIDPLLTPLVLTQQEMDSLVAFLRALSDGDGPAGHVRSKK